MTAPGGERVPRAQSADVKVVGARAQVGRENGMRRVVDEANIRGRDLGGFVSEVQQRLAPLVKELPSGYYVAEPTEPDVMALMNPCVVLDVSRPSVTVDVWVYTPALVSFEVRDAAGDLVDDAVLTVTHYSEGKGARIGKSGSGRYSAVLPAWLDVIVARVPQKHVELNRQAFYVGREGNWLI